MNEREELSRKLLEESGLNEGALPRTEREGLRAIVEAERRRGKHVRNVMLMSWVVLVFLVITSVTVAIFGDSLGLSREVNVGAARVPVGFPLTVLALLLIFITFVISIMATISWGLRMAFGPRGVEERLERIEAQVARVEAARQDEKDTGTLLNNTPGE